MNVKIEKVDNNSAGEWNQIINESSHGTIFHNWDWLTIAGKHSGFTLHPLVGYAGGNPVGVIPLFQRNVFGINMVLSPPPHVAIIYLGPVLMLDTINLQSKRENIYVSFLDAVNSYIQELRAKYVNICLPPKLSDPRPFTWSGYTVKPD